MKILAILFFIITFYFSFAPKTLALSSYVLPYPSAMPGSVYYKIHLVWEKIMQFWYFGDLGRFDYCLKQSDKYLVEAKTLFEYKQYLLGFNAIRKSDNYFLQTKPHLVSALRHGKNTDEKEKILKIAAQKHIEVLEKIESEAPKTFLWQPEKSATTNLNFLNILNSSITIRKKYE